MKKKTIIISAITALVIAAAAVITAAAISINSRSHVDFKNNNNNIGIEESAQISALLKDIRPKDEGDASATSATVAFAANFAIASRRRHGPSSRRHGRIHYRG